jgi:ketosteroid isomerase-like protein
MKNTKSLRLTVLIAGLLSFGLANAQDQGDDSVEVWDTVEQQWDAEENGDNRWIDRRLSDDFMGWSKASPAPQDKTSVRNWDKFRDDLGEMTAHELFPLSIVVHGDMAVAHYLYTSAYTDKEGETETSNGRFTDVLVRDGDDWKFIAWHGGDDE